MQAGRRDPGELQFLDLVVHQADQRRHHQTTFFEFDRRKLVAKRFPASRRHDPQKIAAALQGVDQFFLPRLKRVVAEDGFQQSDCHQESPAVSHVIGSPSHSPA